MAGQFSVAEGVLQFDEFYGSLFVGELVQGDYGIALVSDQLFIFRALRLSDDWAMMQLPLDQVRPEF